MEIIGQGSYFLGGWIDETFPESNGLETMH